MTPTTTATTAPAHTHEFVQVAGGRAEVRKGGSGSPLIVLHSELWIPGWTRVLQELAKRHTVYVPSMPGFGQTDRLEWIMNMDDLAVWLVSFVEQQKIQTPVNVLGLSMGAWVAIQAAAVNRGLFKKMVLVNPIGVKARDGDEMWDYYRYSAREAITQAFTDPKACAEFEQYYGKTWTLDENEQIEVNREMACRLTWEPYMWAYTTRFRAETITTPTQIIVGKDDKVVPNSCGEIIHQTIRGSRFNAISGGHALEMEQPEQVAKLALEFLGA